MSDPTSDSPTHVFRIPDEPHLHELTIPPSVGWVVHEVLRTRDSQRLAWAWCRVTDAAPGYDTVIYTENDGVTHIDPGSDPRLGPVLFKVFC